MITVATSYFWYFTYGSSLAAGHPCYFVGFLPEQIRKRKSKFLYTDNFRHALLPLAAELLRDGASIRLVDLGYVDPGSLRERLERFSQGLESNEGQLRQILLFEFWLRNHSMAFSISPAFWSSACLQSPIG